MNKLKSQGLLLLIFASSLSYATDLKNVEVVFEAVGKPSFIKIKGEANKLTHSEVKVGEHRSDVFEFDLNELNTGIDMRDEHMKEKYLNVKEFPKATLTLPFTDKSNVELAAPTDIAGTLTLHGQTKPVAVKASRNGKKITSNFEIKLSEFGIEIPEWSGIKVADTVKVRTNFEPVLNTPVLAR